MTEPLFFDTDCISAFLWINDESLLEKLYPGRIVIPAEVYSELKHPGVSHLKNRIDRMIADKAATKESIQVDSKEYDLFRNMTTHPEFGHFAIGRGEAAAIVLAQKHNGILASNNLKDVSGYVKELHIKHKTTASILKEALDKELITEEEGNVIWSSMLKMRRWLGYDSFSEYLSSCKF